jgi:hypothetical protein
MNKKELVNLIKKIAQTPPARDNDLEGAPPPGTKPAAPANSGAVSGDPNIKVMQGALVNLSKTFTSQRTDLKPSTEPTRKSFADYVSNSYLKDPNGGASPVLDSLKQLSDPKLGGFPIDGKWGPKTYTALHRVTDFASSLMKMVKQFRINVTSYSENDLNGFIGFIEGDKLTQKQKVDNAQEITKHINAISNLYAEVMKSVMSSPAMKEKIEGMPAEKTSALPPQVVEALNAKYNQFMITHQSDAGFLQQPITVSDFASKDALQAWKDKNMAGANIPLTGIIKQLKQQVEKL